jgi:hypothetical protein
LDALLRVYKYYLRCPDARSVWALTSHRRRTNETRMIMVIRSSLHSHRRFRSLLLTGTYLTLWIPHRGPQIPLSLLSTYQKDGHFRSEPKEHLFLLYTCLGSHKTYCCVWLQNFGNASGRHHHGFHIQCSLSKVIEGSRENSQGLAK